MAESGNKSLQEEINNIPLVDEDAPEVSDDENTTSSSTTNMVHDNSVESIQSSGFDMGLDSMDTDLSPDEVEEKERLIQQVLELQNTLEDLSTRVHSVNEENLKLRSENQVLGQYIENLMSASSVFQSTSGRKAKK